MPVSNFVPANSVALFERLWLSIAKFAVHAATPIGASAACKIATPINQRPMHNGTRE
jgi:hypothetical protein